jgi:hypothetical protein
MRNYSIIIIALILSGCQNFEQPLTDQTASVYGSVKSDSGIPIDSCIVGFLFSTIDTVLSENDSTFIEKLEVMDISIKGSYRIDWFLGPVPLPYDRLFAFKDGYKLWHYDIDRDSVINVDKYVDSLNIILAK